MEYRKLGRTGLRASVIGFGAEWIGKMEQAEVNAMAARGAAAGVNIVDCWMSDPAVRSALGEALEPTRDQWIIQGHIGSTWQDGQYVRTRALDHETFQISPFVGPELEAELVGLCSNVRGVRWHPDFTDLIPADGGKPRGIQRFMAHYGITREQTMAFGDGGNDTDMLAYAGIGVAMGNATAEPKAAADYITDDVDHDGVRNALLHFRVLRD